ncbi:zinc-dependent metalloprotease family protein [Nemorincola caseinilytica]|uniref:Zinc-dependent metalloprotease family protein n=1 Tax=Nemorincola caseinilytica TaxID=2054315 RepID=A0ABP8N2K3_9BACT
MPFKAYLAYRADEAALRQLLSGTAAKGADRVLDLPMPDGTFRTFRVWRSDVLPPALAARYPRIGTYSAVATDDAGVTAKLDMTAYGFHAMVSDGGNTSFIDPADNEHSGYYIVHYKRDAETPEGGFRCHVTGNTIEQAAPLGQKGERQQRTLAGSVLRRYRLALSCSHFYAEAVTGMVAPSKENVLSKMTTSVNRINGIYEQEVAITFTFVDNEDTLIFPIALGDPFAAADAAKDPNGLIDKNQQVCDTLIGDANYDIGHVFSVGGEGLAQVGVVCLQSVKALGVTGKPNPYGDAFDVDYVAHEIGHEFGADHTFNNGVSGSCQGNGVYPRSFEPGSGSTIMAYAGICGPDNLQPHSDPYFHGASVQQIMFYATGLGNGCATKIPTGYKAPGIAPFTATYTIPTRTPFELMAPYAVDSTGDSTLTYCWEQMDIGGTDFGKKFADVKLGPLFRSYTPVKTPLRVFPNMDMVRAGTLSNAGVNNASGEKVPEVARSLMFRLSLRGRHSMAGSFHMPDDSVKLYAINVGTRGFTVTSQNTTGITYEGYSQQTVAWDLVSTNIAPISATRVDIFLSLDGGMTWPYFLGNFPNDGSATVNMPNPDTTCNHVRIKVKGGNNVFFNINSKDFSITHNYESAIRIYPVPAHNNLHVEAKGAGVLESVVINSIGQVVWRGNIEEQADLPSYMWGRGVYILKMIDSSSRHITRKFTVN